MSSYSQLLVAIDLSDQSRAIAAKSVELARQWQAQLRLLHVIEFVPVEPMSDALVPVVQGLRIAARHRRDLTSPRLALAYGMLTVLAKWPQVYGQWLYLRDRKKGRHARLIEYKAIMADAG